MTSVKNIVARFVREEEGASLAEYALLLGVITVALIGVIATFRNRISGIFSTTNSALQNPSTTAGS